MLGWRISVGFYVMLSTLQGPLLRVLTNRILRVGMRVPHFLKLPFPAGAHILNQGVGLFKRACLYRREKAEHISSD